MNRNPKIVLLFLSFAFGFCFLLNDIIYIILSIISSSMDASLFKIPLTLFLIFMIVSLALTILFAVLAIVLFRKKK